MGLDMYLKARQNGVKIQDCEDVNNDCDVCNGCGGREIAYWRKANAIHNWFIKNVQDGNDDCGSYPVTMDDLVELQEVCLRVVDSKTDEVSKNLLPTQSGFFFGSTEYDEDYYYDIENTLKKISEIMQTFDFENEDLYYSSSW